MVQWHTHHIILKQILFTLVVCLQNSEGFAQVSVLPGTSVFLSSASDTLYSEGNDLYLSSSISGNGVILLVNTGCMIAEDTPSVPILVLKNCSPQVLGSIEIKHSVSLENSNLLILDHLLLDSNVNITVNNKQYVNTNTLYSSCINLKSTQRSKLSALYANNYILLSFDIEYSKVFWGGLPFYTSISIYKESPPPRFHSHIV